MFSVSGEFPHPEPPKLEKVQIDLVEDGFFMTTTDAYTLANNIDELKAYIKKLEMLIKEMEKQNK